MMRPLHGPWLRRLPAIGTCLLLSAAMSCAFGKKKEPAPASPAAPPPAGERPPQGMYPHFALPGARRALEDLRQAGYRAVQDAKDYSYGTEVFVADPDGLVWALIRPR